MFRGGGTAGGSSSKTKLIFNKQIPKFLEKFKQQYIQNEPKLEDKLAGVCFSTNENMNEYDYENAMVLNEGGEEIKNADKFLGKETTGTKEFEKELEKEKKNEDNKIQENENIKGIVEIATFKPKFMNKKKTINNSLEEKKIKINNKKFESPNKKKLNEKITDTNKDRSKLKDEKDTISKNDNIGKRKLDDYVKLFLEEDSKPDVEEPEKIKRVKKNTLLSFGDDY